MGLGRAGCRGDHSHSYCVQHPRPCRARRLGAVVGGPEAEHALHRRQQKRAPASLHPPNAAIAYCLFDISKDNLIVKTPLPEPAWSLTLSTRAGENFYIVAGADAKRPFVRLLVVPQDRLSEEASTEKTEEGEEQSIIVSPSQTGIVAIRAPLRGESFRAQTLEELRKARCDVQKRPEPLVAVVTPEAVQPSAEEERQQRSHRRRRP